MPWGEAHGPSQALIARRVRLRAADALADAAGLHLAEPSPGNTAKLGDAIRLYREAVVEVERADT